MPDGADDDVIHRQCGRAGWKSYRVRWLAAAAAYRTAHGDPWLLSPAAFTKAQGKKLYRLYDNRRAGKAIANIRRPDGGYRSCPMCGSPGGPSLDHALPRTAFPEFSILRENLVPACTICNTDEKRGVYRGAAAPERLIHPYYDDWASEPLWQVGFGADLQAVVLTPIPSPTVSSARRTTVEFHLKTVLGREWRNSSIRYWADLPRLIRNRVGATVTPNDAKRELELRLVDETLVQGVNGWHSALLRGALADPRVPSFLANAAASLPA